MIWIKDNGQEIETNDRKETIAQCEKMGWKKKKGPGRPPKVSAEDVPQEKEAE